MFVLSLSRERTRLERVGELVGETALLFGQSPRLLAVKKQVLLLSTEEKDAVRMMIMDVVLDSLFLFCDEEADLFFLAPMSELCVDIE
jgi:hypothetical protein